MKLNELSLGGKRVKKAKRVGRGIGSGKGKTAGRGMKGQKSRTGVSINGFEGGQMPLHMRMPKHGFKNPFKKKFYVLTTTVINRLLKSKKISSSKKITISDLNFKISQKYNGLKILNGEKLASGISIQAHSASKSAVDAFKKAGGEIEIINKEKKIVKKNIAEKKDKKTAKSKLEAPKEKVQELKKSDEIKEEKKVTKKKVVSKKKKSNE